MEQLGADIQTAASLTVFVSINSGLIYSFSHIINVAVIVTMDMLCCHNVIIIIISGSLSLFCGSPEL